MPHDKDEDAIKKEAYKDAMREFLAEQKRETFETIGRWAFNIIAGSVSVAVLWLLLKYNGYEKR